MGEVTVTVDAGVCRFKTVIIASMDEEMNITYKIKSECPKVREVGKTFGPVPMFDAIAMPLRPTTSTRSLATRSSTSHVLCRVHW